MRKRRVVGRIYRMSYSWKGHEDRNRRKNRIKRSGGKLGWSYNVKEHKQQHPHHVKASPRGLKQASSSAVWKSVTWHLTLGPSQRSYQGRTQVINKHRSQTNTGHKQSQVTNNHRSSRNTSHQQSQVISKHRSPKITGHKHSQVTPTITGHKKSQVINKHRSPTITGHQETQVTNNHRSSANTGHQRTQVTNNHRSHQQSQATNKNKSSKHKSESDSLFVTYATLCLKKNGEEMKVK